MSFLAQQSLVVILIRSMTASGSSTNLGVGGGGGICPKCPILDPPLDMNSIMEQTVTVSIVNYTIISSVCCMYIIKATKLIYFVMIKTYAVIDYHDQPIDFVNKFYFRAKSNENVMTLLLM